MAYTTNWLEASTAGPAADKQHVSQWAMIDPVEEFSNQSLPAVAPRLAARSQKKLAKSRSGGPWWGSQNVSRGAVGLAVVVVVLRQVSGRQAATGVIYRIIAEELANRVSDEARICQLWHVRVYRSICFIPAQTLI